MGLSLYMVVRVKLHMYFRMQVRFCQFINTPNRHYVLSFISLHIHIYLFMYEFILHTNTFTYIRVSRHSKYMCT